MSLFLNIINTIKIGNKTNMAPATFAGTVEYSFDVEKLKEYKPCAIVGLLGRYNNGV